MKNSGSDLLSALVLILTSAHFLGICMVRFENRFSDKLWFVAASLYCASILLILCSLYLLEYHQFMNTLWRIGPILVGSIGLMLVAGFIESEDQ
jgi:hypothetical protein